MAKPDPVDFKGLPQSLPAERMILGALINGSFDFHSCRATLSVDDFALEANRRIYRRIEEMSEAGIAIDHVTVSEELIKYAELESAGGLGYVVRILRETREKLEALHTGKPVPRMIEARPGSVLSGFNGEVNAGGGDEAPPE